MLVSCLDFGVFVGFVGGFFCFFVLVFALNIYLLKRYVNKEKHGLLVNSMFLLGCSLLLLIPKFPLGIVFLPLNFSYSTVLPRMNFCIFCRSENPSFAFTLKAVFAGCRIPGLVIYLFIFGLDSSAAPFFWLMLAHQLAVGFTFAP